MNLQVFGTSASLAAPAIALEHLPRQQAPMSIVVQAKPRMSWGGRFHDAARTTLQQRQRLASRDNEIEHLKLLIAKRTRSNASGAGCPIANACRAARECNKTYTAAPAGAFAAGNGKVFAEADRMPGLWRRVEASRRRCFRNPGVRAGAIQTDPTGASETSLRVL
jgi:hypothetical protein